MTEDREHYEVQHYTLVDGWVNCWTTYDENDDETPTTYETFKDAVYDLDNMFEEQEYEIIARIMDQEHRHSDEEYRIVKVVDGVVADIFQYVWKRREEDQ